ncbi:TetR/AcrR family transcriptional regulator [Priestia flexa]|uniref:TetR/AcrR family transcriptional regulator n=1 Tax=Priestia flexa TaxID=86664 RepID=UPI001B32A5E8|nr:TetR/AcrR family transcriptional regulator [Priestia flexa]
MARRKEFDVNDVLEKAISVFWEQGYEKTSLQNLVEHMGIHKRSMYDTFGDKHSLYIQALERCVDTTEEKLRKKVEEVIDVKKSIRKLLESTLEYEEIDRKGCLVVNCATELALRDEIAAKEVKRSFEGTQKILLELIKHGQATGELDTRHDPETLAMAILNLWLGIRVQTRVVSDRNELYAMIDGALTLLD